MKKTVDKKTIVLIEDEEVMVNLLTSKLEVAGYEVKSAMDGLDGLELIRSENPDLVLLDMMLPRLSGFGILEKLNEEKIIPKLPVIIISNSGQQIELDRAMQLGARDSLIKVNFDPNEIVTKVRVILEGNPGKKKQGASDITVLIVEDDAFLVEMLARKLDKAEIQSFHAMDVDHARSILLSEKIDLILLDIMLPGTDGISYLKELKADKKLRSIPVIIISNLGQKEEIQRGMDAGAVHYIVKANAEPDDIVFKVKEVLNK